MIIQISRLFNTKTTWLFKIKVVSLYYTNKEMITYEIMFKQFLNYASNEF